MAEVLMHLTEFTYHILQTCTLTDAFDVPQCPRKIPRHMTLLPFLRNLSLTCQHLCSPSPPLLLQMAEPKFEDLLKHIQSKQLIPQEILESNKGIILRDIRVVQAWCTLRMQSISRIYLENLVKANSSIHWVSRRTQ